MLAVTRPHPSQLIVLTGVLTSALVGITHGQQSQEPAAGFRIVRIAAGPRGSEVGGQFRLEQERTTFSRSSDTQVVVQFQWEGRPGVHRLAARWRSPTGDVAISEFEYNARDRLFGAYWTLPISPATPLGSWSIEATIDGSPSGAFTFEIADGEVPTPAISRPPLPPSELYRRLEAVYVSIDRLTSRGGMIDRNAGFVIGPSSIATAFSAIDAADTLEVTTADAARQRVTSIASFDRRQNWAVIAATTKAGPTLPLAPADSTKVGDRCYSMESGPTGVRVLAECTIVGRNAINAAGARFIVQFLNGRGVPGSPVLNEFGEVIGLIGGAPSSFNGLTVYRAGPDQGAPVVPASVIRTATDQALSIQELKRRGAPEGGFARQMQRNPVRPIDEREQFSPADGRFFVFLTWDPRERVRGTMVFRLYDENNQLVTASQPGKVDFKPGADTFGQWELSVPSRLGNYRADVLVGDVAIWRGFFRVIP